MCIELACGCCRLESIEALVVFSGFCGVPQSQRILIYDVPTQFFIIIVGARGHE